MFHNENISQSEIGNIMGTVLKLLVFTVYLSSWNLLQARSTKKNLFDCDVCSLMNVTEIFFNEFGGNTSSATDIRITKSKISNFNTNSLQKFNKLRGLTISNFILDDYNTFNNPGLFEHNINISRLSLKYSEEKIVLHDEVFRGLKNVQYLTLEHLQLDAIPRNLFKDMERVVEIYLNSNKIKVLDTSFELNYALKEVTLIDNPVFSEPHNRIRQFHIGGTNLRFYFANFTIHTRKTVKKLLNNHRIDELHFESLETDFDIRDYLNMDTDRNYNFLGIDFKAYPSGYLDWDYLNANGSVYQDTFNEVRLTLKDKFNIQIRLPISGEACHSKWMIKKFFYPFLNLFQNPGFYFEESRVLLTFERTCPKQIEFFDEEFNENCLSMCKCLYNPLADQVTIDCSNRNLTEFPIIPYPSQYENIYKIKILFGNNLLRNVSFLNQDNRVLQKLTELQFQNNLIESFILMNSRYNYIERINLCKNPILSNIPSKKLVLQMSVSTYNFNKYTCSDFIPAGLSKMDAAEYVLKQKSSDFIDSYLNKVNP